MSTPIVIDGITFEPSYATNQDFAQLLINGYNAGFPIRLPQRELVFENSDSSTAVVTGMAHTITEPNVIADPTSYLNRITGELSYIPVGFMATIMISPTMVNGAEVSNLAYQQTAPGVWTMTNSYDFNAPLDTELYNEYNDGSNNP